MHKPWFPSSPSRALWVFFASLLVVPAGVAQNSAPADKTSNAPQATIDAGKETFSNDCAVCHGDDATGGRGPDLMHAKSVRGDKNGDLLAPIIKNGRPDKGMPALGLTDEEIAGIVAFLHDAVQTFDHEHGGAPADSCLDKVMTGDASAAKPDLGKRTFDDKCVSCHSATGDLKGVATKYVSADLQSHILCTPKGPANSKTPDPASAHRDLLSKLSDSDKANLLAYLQTLK